jgi:hypothetical protein
MGLVVLNAQQGAGDGEVEAAGARRAWVEVEDSLVVLHGGIVGVAVEDNRDAGGLRVEVEVFAGVDHVDQTAGQLDGLGGGEEGAGTVGVDVAADGGDGGDTGEVDEDGGIADVAGVKDVIDTGQGGKDFGAEEAVGVGEYADECGGGFRHIARGRRGGGCGGPGSRGGRRR